MQIFNVKKKKKIRSLPDVLCRQVIQCRSGIVLMKDISRDDNRAKESKQTNFSHWFVSLLSHWMIFLVEINQRNNCSSSSSLFVSFVRSSPMSKTTALINRVVFPCSFFSFDLNDSISRRRSDIHTVSRMYLY